MSITKLNHPQAEAWTRIAPGSMAKKRNRKKKRPTAPEGDQWVNSTYRRMGHGDGADAQEMESSSPRPKPRPQPKTRAYQEGPRAGDLTESGMAQYRGQGDGPRDRNATLITGFEPQRHMMVVEGRPVMVGSVFTATKVLGSLAS